MANNCFNQTLISGSEEVIDRLQELFKSKAQDESFATFADRFFPEPCEDYGSKWWDFWVERNEPDYLIVLGDSAWCPPDEFLRLLSLHYPVRVVNEYEEQGFDFGGTTTYEAGKVDDSCYTYLEWLWVSDSDQFWHEVESYAENCEDFAEFKKVYLDKFYTPLSEKDLQEIEKEFNFVNN